MLWGHLLSLGEQPGLLHDCQLCSLHLDIQIRAGSLQTSWTPSPSDYHSTWLPIHGSYGSTDSTPSSSSQQKKPMSTSDSGCLRSPCRTQQALSWMTSNTYFLGHKSFTPPALQESVVVLNPFLREGS
jgi:hypothetical protein